jgi:predicted chitinase
MALPINREAVEEITLNQEILEESITSLHKTLKDIKDVLYDTYILALDQFELEEQNLFRQKEILDEQRRARNNKRAPSALPVNESTGAPYTPQTDQSGGFFGFFGNAGIAAGAATGGILGTLFGSKFLSGAKSAMVSASSLGGKTIKGGLAGLFAYAIGSTVVSIASSLTDDPELKKTIEEEGRQAVNYGAIGVAIGSLFGPGGALIGGLLGIAVSVLDDIFNDDSFVRNTRNKAKEQAKKVIELSEPASKVIGSGSSTTELSRDFSRRILAGEEISDGEVRRIAIKRIKDRGVKDKPSDEMIQAEKEIVRTEIKTLREKAKKINDQGSVGPTSLNSEQYNAKFLATSLKTQGFSDPEIRQIVAQSDKESAGFIAQEENFNYSASRLKETFPSYFKDEAEAQRYVNMGPEAIANKVYGNRMGNEGDEGFKYRGRGFIQLTGKDNYRRMGEKIGVDLVSNPELASDPEIAAKITGEYFRQEKARGVDISTPRGATSAVRPVNWDSQEVIDERAAIANKYSDIASLIGGSSGDNMSDRTVDSIMPPPSAPTGNISLTGGTTVMQSTPSPPAPSEVKAPIAAPIDFESRRRARNRTIGR